ncbi:MAG: NAD-dependent epimerase/dehydratase family protein [Elusimicrobia bacterium]|nr:NAD-dependent epimerase/dehydratase family protein [Elusimicrobiota bacterium]
MKHKKILITGTNGFIGENLLEYFSERPRNYKVFSPKRKELDLLNDMAVSKYIKANKIEVVIHCASCGGTRKNNYDEGNVDIVSQNLRMFFNLSRCLTPDMRMINMGSGAEYDKRNSMHKIKETFFDKHVPIDSYGYSKYIIAKYIEKTDNIINLRIFGLYGKYEDYSYKFISNTIVKNILGLPITINQNVSFDYSHIEDFVKIVDKFIAIKPKYKHYNATPSKSIDLVGIAELINKMSSKKSKIKVLNSGMNIEYTGSNLRLRNEFKGFSFTKYEEGIAELYNYYLSCRDDIDFKTIKQDACIKYCKKIFN